MKVLIIGFTKVKYMPYLSFYTSNLNHVKSADLLYWNRDGAEDITPTGIKNQYVLNYTMSDSIPLVKKLKGFFKFRKLALKILKSEQYDKIILLHTTPAVLLHDYVHKHFKNKYILDYRDITYERIRWYQKLVSRLIHESAATFVSSEGFLDFLPRDEKIYLSHNIQPAALEHNNVRKHAVRNRQPIRISFWGLIRQAPINKQIIDSLKNDSRFELHYYGREQQEAEELKDFCLKNAVDNVFFHGEYSPEQRYDFAQTTDMLHNIYSHGKTEGLAMGNKYYDGIVFAIPQLCSVGSYMGKRITAENTGMVVDPYSPTFADDIYNYYTGLDWIRFEESCAMAVDTVINEYTAGEKMIANFLEITENT